MRSNLCEADSRIYQAARLGKCIQMAMGFVSSAMASGEFIAADDCSKLVTIALLFSFTLSRLNANLLVILFKRGQIFACFTELTFFHALTNIPVDECALGIHQIELVVDA